MNNDILTAAKLYASLGWHVLPTLGKVPQGNAWQDHATAGNVAGLFDYVSAFDGVGVLLGEKSGIVDIDCDSEEAENNLLSLFGGEIPNTPTFSSARGSHFIFKWRKGLPNKAVFKVEGIEFRVGNGAAAQTVFPPSGSRTWDNDCQSTVMEFPHWDKILKRYEESQKPKKFKKYNGSTAPHYGDGNTLNVPRWLAKHGREIIGRTDGTDGVTRWHIECPNIEAHTSKNSFRDCCVTQSPAGVLGGCCFHQSCGMNSWDALRDRIGTLEYSDFNEMEANESPVDFSAMLEPKKRIEAVDVQKKDEPVRIPVEDWKIPGLIGDVVSYTLSNSLYPQPELALAGALALMGVLTGRKVQDERGTRTNIYIMGLCPAAGGKEMARKINKDILSLSGGESLLGPESIGSSSGILSVLAESPASLFQLDEIGKMFVLMQNPKAGHLYKIGSELLKLYSSASGQYTGDAYAETKKIKRINQPHLCVYGTSTPEVFWNSMNTENVREGLVGRFLVFDTLGYVRPKKYKPFELPENILNRVRWWLDFVPGGSRAGNLNAVNFRAITIPYAKGANERIEDHIQAIDSRRIKEESIRAAIWSRSAEKAVKLSLLFACSRAELREPGVIELEDVENGIRLANLLTRRMLEKIEEHVSDNENEAKIKKVLRQITGEITQSELTRRTQFLRDRRERNEIVSMLIETGRILIETKDSDGNKPVTFIRRNSKSEL